MLKQILNLEGAQQLSKKEQNAINGGSGGCIDNCSAQIPCPSNMHCVAYWCSPASEPPHTAYECVPNGDPK
jgi:hypothetical protein